MATSQPTLHLVPPHAGANANDSLLTVCSVGALAMVLSNVLHEGLGHAATALLTVSPSGVLSTVAWDSVHDSRLVDAAGTLVNLAAAVLFLLLLRSSRSASAATRLFLLLTCALNLFAGTGYFLFSGITNFGDWADVIHGLHPHPAWRGLLIMIGVLAYLGALFITGNSLIRDVRLRASDRRRISRIMLAAYLSAVAVATAAGLLNPLGLKFVLLSSLPATAGAGSGLLYMQYYARKDVQPAAAVEPVNRSFSWIAVSGVCALLFIFLLGPGIHLSR